MATGEGIPAARGFVKSFRREPNFSAGFEAVETERCGDRQMHYTAVLDVQSSC